MTRFGWSLVEATAHLLQPDQREAVLGDLMEAGESTRHSLLGILSLALRNQAELWRDKRPWLAGLGICLPASFLLMGASLSVSQSYQRVLSSRAFVPFLSQVLLLIAWSWSGGYAAGKLSRQTIRVSAVLCCFPHVFSAWQGFAGTRSPGSACCFFCCPPSGEPSRACARSGSTIA